MISFLFLRLDNYFSHTTHFDDHVAFVSDSHHVLCTYKYIILCRLMNEYYEYYISFALRKWKWGQKINVYMCTTKRQRGGPLLRWWLYSSYWGSSFVIRWHIAPLQGERQSQMLRESATFLFAVYIISGRSGHLRSIGLFFFPPKVAIFQNKKANQSLMVILSVDNIKMGWI